MSLTASSSVAPSKLIGPLLALSAGVMWSFGSLTVRMADGADPFQYLVWRSLGLVVVLEVLSRMQGGPSLLPRLRSLDRLGWLGAAGYMLAAVAFIFALKTTTVANAVLFSSTSPLISAVIARVVLGERIGVAGTIAIVLGLAGLGVMTGGDIGSGALIGNLAGLASALGFATYAVAVRMAQGRDWTPALSGYGVLTVAVCAATTLMNGRPLTVPVPDIGLAVLHGTVLIAIGTILFNKASRAVPAVGLTVLAQTETVFAPLWVYLLLGETPKPTTLIGGALVLAAVLIKALAAPPAASSPTVAGPAE